MNINLKSILSVLILVGFAAFVELYFGWSKILAPWMQLDYTALGAALALTFMTYWLRAQRQYDYFRDVMTGRFLTSLKVMLQHNLLNNFLPMRSGEISFPVLMARHFNVPASRSVPVLLWFRLMDLHTLGAIGLAAAGQAWLTPVVNIVALGCWLPLPFALYLVHTAALRGLSTPHSRVQHVLHNTLASLPNDARAFWRAWGWTWINWLAKLGAFAWVLLLFLPTTWPAAWLASIAGDLTSVLPIHGVAGAGTYEAGVVAALLPFHVDAQQALQAAVNLHLFLLGSTVLGGVVALLLPGMESPAAKG